MAEREAGGGQRGGWVPQPRAERTRRWPRRYPSVRSAFTRGYDPLPRPRGALIGREEDLRRLCEALLRDDAGAVTLVGPGGCGKTRLALEAATRLAGRIPGGVIWVSLTAAADLDAMLHAVARACRLPELPGQSLLDSLCLHLVGQRTLLVLDNTEHLPGLGATVATLLSRCPRLLVLATGRRPLHIRDERRLPVAPLAVDQPATGEQRATDATDRDAAMPPAVQLFVARACAVQPGFQLTDEYAGLVAAICRRLDGLPLAIELAAARMNALTPGMLLSHLDQPLGLLTGGVHDLAPHQRTLRAAVAWSYDLLSAEQQALFRRLGVFVGGVVADLPRDSLSDVERGLVAGDGAEKEPHPFGHGAGTDTAPVVADRALILSATSGVRPAAPAQTVGRPRPPAALDTQEQIHLPGLLSLVDASLLQREDGPDGMPRYRMLETVRAFALDRLAERGEEQAALQVLAAYVLRVAEALEPELTTPERTAGLERLDAERDNIAAVLCWLCARPVAAGADEPSAAVPSRAEAALRLVGALWVWFRQRCPAQGRAWAEAALALAGDGVAGGVRDRAAFVAGQLALVAEDRAGAQEWLAQAAEGAHRRGDRSLQALALSYLARAGEAEAGRSRARESLTLARADGDERAEAWALVALGSVLAQQESAQDAALDVLRAAAAMYRRRRDGWLLAVPLAEIGRIALARGQAVPARAVLLEALAGFEASGDRLFAARVRLDLARVAAQERAWGDAARWCAAAQTDCIAVGHPAGAREALLILSGLCRQAGRGLLADALDAAGREWHRGNYREAGADGTLIERTLSALASTPRSGSLVEPGGGRTAYPDGLSAREVEVLRLLSQGKSNAAIAAALVLSTGTVGRHTANIYAKISARNRAEAAAYAQRTGLASM